MLFRTFALNEDAFARECDARFIFPSKPFRDVYARLLNEIEAGTSALLLIGAPGVGKTTLLRQLGENLAAWRWSVHWGASQPGADQPAASGRPDDPSIHQAAIHQAAQAEAGSADAPMAMIVDAADDLSDAALQQVCCSTMVPRSGRAAEVLLLAGTEGLVDKLACSPHGFSFRLVRMRCLPPGEIQPYVRHRLTTAGHTGADVFTPEALDVLADYSRGIPGTINRIAVASLLLADVEGLKRVDADLVQEAAGDLGIGGIVPTFPASDRLPAKTRSGPREGHDIAVGQAGPLLTEAARRGRPRPANYRWRLGAAGVIGAVALAVSLAYFRGESASSLLSAGVVAAGLHRAPDKSAEAAAARETSASSGDAVRSLEPVTLTVVLNEKSPSGAGNQLPDREITAVASAPSDQGAPEKPTSSAEFNDALGEGDTLVARGDIAAARLYYALASRHGSSEATRKLAQSYDPLFLQGAQVSGLQPDVGKAIGGYSAAAASGDREAADRLSALLDKMRRDMK